MADRGSPDATSPIGDELYRVIFGTETRVGRSFDVALIGAILSSLVVGMRDSVASLLARHGPLFLGRA